MKNSFKRLLGLIALFTLLFMFSCTEDLNESNKADSIHGIKKTKITFDEIKDNQKILNEINTITQKQQEFKNNNKLIYDSANEFYIDTDNIILQEGSLGKSYTFNILRASESPYVENLTIHIDNQNGSIAILAIYNLTEVEKEIILNGGAIADINQKTLIFPVNGLPTEFMTGYTSKEAPVTGITIYQFSNGQCGVIDHIENLGAEGSMIYYTVVPCPVVDAGGSGSGSSSSSSSGSFTFGYDYTVNSNNQSTTTSNTSTGGGSSSGNYIIPHVMTADQKKKKEFLMNLDDNQEDCYNSLNVSQKDDILDYIGSLTAIGNNSTNCSSNNSQEEQFNEVEDLMAAMCGNPDMTFDVQKSLKSPANIDFSAIDTTTPEGIKLNCIFNKLMNTCEFKEIFYNVFSDNDRINIKFEISNLLESVNGAKTSGSYSNGILNQTIKVNQNWLTGFDASDIKTAQAILHECIHAYLNVKKIECQTNTSLTDINAWELDDLINQIFITNGACVFSSEPANQDQHHFMFNNLIPHLSSLMADLKDSLISLQDQTAIEGPNYLFNPTTGELIPHSWDDFFKYLAMDGLDHTTSFINEVTNVPLEFAKYIHYSVHKAQISQNSNCND